MDGLSDKVYSVKASYTLGIGGLYEAIGGIDNLHLIHREMYDVLRCGYHVTYAMWLAYAMYGLRCTMKHVHCTLYTIYTVLSVCHVHRYIS